MLNEGTAWLTAALFAVGIGGPVSVARADEGEGPRAVIRTVTDQVIEVLSNTDSSAEQKRARIEQIADRHFDFRTLSRLVLARNWKELTGAQQEEFVEEFKRHLSLTYGDNVESYQNEQVLITGDRAEQRGDWTVRTKVKRPRGGEDILVNYRLRKQGDEWAIIDVVIEGVSLVANFRSQFQDILSRKGPAQLIELLREKNARGESLKS